MKLETRKLVAALKGPAKLAGGRVSIPILSSVLLSGEAGKLSVRGSNHYGSCFESVEADGELKPVLVRGDVLGAALGGMGGTTELELDKSKLVLRGDCTTKLACAFDEKEIAIFPGLPETGGGIGVNCVDLAKAIRAVSWAAARASERAILESVYVHCTSKAIECVACDGGSLCLVEMPAIAAEFEVLIPSAWAGWIADMLERPGAVLSKSKSGTQLIVAHDGGSFVCPLTDGAYPNYRNVIPKQPDELGEIERERWIENLSLAVNLSAAGETASTCVVALKFDAVGCAMSLTNSGHEWQTAIGGKFTKAAGSFSAVKLVSALSSFEAQKVKLFVGGDLSKSALVMKAENQTVIMMPWRTKA
jgi:DNA polymerase III sliding clamp (beta) subunit (PCNA family)